ncbi:MAG TPA: hypothetical protein VNF47_19655 [Streptosporangiaceae bacterium]|nr:hypothetical protein [Streptosporangiaceae bacterium]
MARELLAMTSEFPDSKGGMLILLTEYRRALYDMVAERFSDTQAAPTRT